MNTVESSWNETEETPVCLSLDQLKRKKKQQQLFTLLYAPQDVHAWPEILALHLLSTKERAT